MEIILKKKFDTYPNRVSKKLHSIRSLIFEVAKQHQLGEVSETLKWGEPSYSVAGGSPIRMDWKQRSPNSVSLYFNCNTTLVETFREIYADRLQLIGKRELRLAIDEPIPTAALCHCIELALRYHKIKSLPLLGC